MSPPRHTTHSCAALRATHIFSLFYLFVACLSSAVHCVDAVDDELDSLQKNWTAVNSICRDPGRIHNGQRVPEFKQGQLFQYQQELHFKCNIGYRLQQGVEKMTCGPNGQWLPLRRQRCHPVVVFCPRPTLSHGRVLIPGADFSTSTNLEVQCNEGFRLQNKFVNRLECKLDGTWTGHNGAFTEELPVCVELTCPPLPEMPNSIIEYKGARGWDHGFKDGAIAKYVCRQGYKNVAVIGSDESKCHNGTWTGRTLIFCDILSCSPPPQIPNAIVKVINSDQDEDVAMNYPVGVSVIYWCISGFALMGSSARFKCMHDGHWSPLQIPTCQEIDEEQGKKCSAPPTIMFGYVKEPLDEYASFSEVTYACHDGFHLFGPDQLTCNVDGQWQPDPPMCELILDKEDFDWDGFREMPTSAQEKPRVQELPQQTWDAMGAQTISFLTAGCVMGILFLVLISAMIAQRHGCGKWCQMQLRPSVSGGSAPGGLHGPPLCHDQDRASLIAFADGVQVALPSYEEATSNQFPSDFIYNGSTLLPRPGAFSSNRHNRYVLHRSNGTHDHSNGNAGGPGRQPGSSHSACGRSSSLADSLGSTDTVTPSEVSTTVTVDTLSSTLSQGTSSTNSTRAFCGSLTSFDTAGSGSILNIEGVPLLEESETEKLLSSTEMQAQQQQEEAT